MSIICKASVTHIITLMFGLGSLISANGENKMLSLSPWPVLIDTGSSQNILKPSSWLQISCKCLHIFFSFFHDNNRKCSWETVPKTMTPDVATSMCFVIETQVTCCFSRVKSRKITFLLSLNFSRKFSNFLSQCLKSLPNKKRTTQNAFKVVSMWLLVGLSTILH